ncbi:unnamed protein product, partial [Meganyctiphanes norvegica]
MVFPGIIRRINKNLPNLLQALLIICVIHYMGQGVLFRVQRKLHMGRFAKNEPSTTTRTINGKVMQVHKAGFQKPAKTRPTRPPRSTTTTTTVTPPPPRPSFSVMEDVHKYRLETLHKACARWGLGKWSKTGTRNLTDEELTLTLNLPKAPLYQQLLVSEKRKLATCPTSRTGANWLAKRFLQLTGNYDDLQVRKLREPATSVARHAYPYLTSWEKYPVVLSNTINIIVARHPLERLLASYRHTLEDAERNPHGYLHYGRRIVRTYRQQPWPHKEPTFGEFVKFILAKDTRHMEEAWQPIARHCTPCHIDYNLIANYETLWYDFQYAMDKAELPKLNTTDYISYWLTPEKRSEYFSQLTVTQVLQLYKKYKLDFQLFGYSIDEHMADAKPGDEPLDPALLLDLPKPPPIQLEKIIYQEENFVLTGERETDVAQAPVPGGSSPSNEDTSNEDMDENIMESSDRANKVLE